MEGRREGAYPLHRLNHQVVTASVEIKAWPPPLLQLRAKRGHRLCHRRDKHNHRPSRTDTLSLHVVCHLVLAARKRLPWKRTQTLQPRLIQGERDILPQTVNEKEGETQQRLKTGGKRTFSGRDEAIQGTKDEKAA
ncbi:hybrid sensor histidine kinase/response regulator [Sesbania bispinosa]|nr:hybrid sensor histidine kinase/response regulator [Sesbania bispinosa]